MNHFPFHRHWDEFQWEKEIRRDERRISGYFRELAACLDLPAEEDLIYGQLSSQSDLVPSAAQNDALRNWISAHDDDADEEEERPRRATVSGTVDELDSLCVQWNLLASRRLRAELQLPGLGITCAFAKLLARTADFLEPERNCEIPLLISLGKRALQDLGDLKIRLEYLARFQKSMLPEISFFLSRLARIRETLVIRIETLRQDGGC